MAITLDLGRWSGLSTRARELDKPQRLTSDGKLLLALLGLTLLGPYLPILALARVVGVDIPDGQDGARLDNLAIPLAAGYLLARSVANNKLTVPIHVIWYLAFLVWLALVTLIWWSNIPAEHAEANARGIGLLRSVDAYTRPVFVLLIAANVRITRYDFRMLIRLILGVGLLVGLISAAQLYDATAVRVNNFLFDHYDNNPGQTFWQVLNQGRAASLMPQLSTLGMYMVLSLGLLAAQVMGSRAISSPWLYGIVVSGVFLGGEMSGSKVFVGGLSLLGIGLIFAVGMVRRRDVPKIVAAVLAIVVVWSTTFVIFPEQANRLAGLFTPRPPVAIAAPPPVIATAVPPAVATALPQVSDTGDSIIDGLLDPVYVRFVKPLYTSYFASRFDTSTGKIYRTGATDIAIDYPITGLGLNVVNRTTDSMALGIFIMSGAVGSVLYLAMLAAVAVGLLNVSRRRFDPELAAVARVLLILTAVFLVVSLGFHTFIQDRAGDVYWLLVGLLLGPLAARSRLTAAHPVQSDQMNERPEIGSGSASVKDSRMRAGNVSI